MEPQTKKKQKPRDVKRFIVDLSPQEFEAINLLAKKEYTSRNSLVRRAIRQLCQIP